MNTYTDIPRVYTAIAEWGACLIYLLPMKRKIHGRKMIFVSLGMLVMQTLFLILTDKLPLAFWIPSMMLAVGLMFLFFKVTKEGTILDCAYCCIQAFALAELAASLEWQLYNFFEINSCGLRFLLLMIVYGMVFFIMEKLIKRYFSLDTPIGITMREFVAAFIIGVVVFAVSNLSFLSVQTPFSSSYGTEVLNIRTLVDFGGVAILFAHFLQCYDLRVRHELEAMQNVLHCQYIQYQQSRENIALINQKYHDLKHQLNIIRLEQNQERRNKYLDNIEQGISLYEAQNKTGNPVLDTILTSKSMYCTNHDITFTCVADGKLLNFMDVMDLCSMVGNALDNAIEYEEKKQDIEKRLIHVSLSNYKQFVLFKVENYCEDTLSFEDGLPTTTKKNKELHGYGLKSVRYIVDKYSGILTVQVSNEWFTLKVLFPR